MKLSTTTILALVCAALAGALARDLLLPRAHADAADVITRSDVTAIVRALADQAKATQELGRDVKEAARACK